MFPACFGLGPVGSEDGQEGPIPKKTWLLGGPILSLCSAGCHKAGSASCERHCGSAWLSSLPGMLRGKRGPPRPPCWLSLYPPEQKRKINGLERQDFRGRKELPLPQRCWSFCLTDCRSWLAVSKMMIDVLIKTVNDSKDMENRMHINKGLIIVY